MFWTFVFPLVMSVALAIAFPSGGARPVVVGLEPGPRAGAIRAALAAEGVEIRDVPRGDMLRALREGDVHLVVALTAPPTYRFDLEALPLTALVDAMRAVVLDGATVAGVSGELALLAAWGVVPFAVALRVFRWR